MYQSWALRGLCETTVVSCAEQDNTVTVGNTAVEQNRQTRAHTAVLELARKRSRWILGKAYVEDFGICSCWVHIDRSVTTVVLL